MKNMERGKFIVFEGTDGSGKSTQAKMLSKYLAGKKIPCYLTFEPTDSFVGAFLRAIMSGRAETDEYTIAALFAADRLDHIQNNVNGIQKKLEEGTWVICDRYYFSSFAYNGGQADLDWVIGLNLPAMKMLPPDLTVFLDLPPEEGMARVLRRGETERYETLEKQRNIRQKFFDVFARFPEEKIKIVKSEPDKNTTHGKICALIEEEFHI